MNKKFALIALAPLALSLASCNNGPEVIEFDYIYTAQPVVSATNSEIFKNVQEDFVTKNKVEIFQASIFVKNTADQGKVNKLLSSLNEDIASALARPALIKTGIEKCGSAAEQQNKYGVAGAMATKVTSADNGFSLSFKSALLNKEDVGKFVNILTNNSLGTLSDEVFYASDTEASESFDGLKILAPTGAPSVAFYNFAEYANFTTTSNPKEGLLPLFQKDTYDIIVAPTQGGLTQIIKNNAAYKIAASITHGNFYIVSTGRDKDNTLNEGDKVLIFQEDDVPGKVFKNVYGDLNLNVTAVAAVSETKLVIENNGTLKK